MQTRLRLLLLLALVVSGCLPHGTNDQGTLALPTVATAIPTSTLQPAMNYTIGLTDLPDDYFFFVEVTTHDSGSGTCIYALSAQQPPLGYKYVDGHLHLAASYLHNLFPDLVLDNDLAESWKRVLEGVTGFFFETRDSTYNLGGGTYTTISVMESLPYEAKALRVSVLAVDAEGRAVIEVAGNALWFEPGASREQMEEYEPQAGCRVVRETRIANHGMIEESRLQLETAPFVR